MAWVMSSVKTYKQVYITSSHHRRSFEWGQDERRSGESCGPRRALRAACLLLLLSGQKNFHLLQSIPLSRVDYPSRPPRCSNPHHCMFITAGKDSPALHHCSAESASGRTVYSSPSLFVIYYSLIVMIMSAENVKCWKDSDLIYSTMLSGGFIPIASVKKQQWQEKLPFIRRKPWAGPVPWGRVFRVLKRGR